MRVLRLTLAALLGAGVLVLAGAGPALACSCAVASTKAYVVNADSIVTGTLDHMKDPPQRRIMSSLDPITYAVTAERTFKGEPASEVTFTSPMSGASCGLERMQVDRRYTFFLNAEGGALTASLCGGTTSASHGLEAEITRWTGPPVTATDASTPAPAPVPDGSQEASPRGSELPPWIVATTVVGVGVLAVAAALLLWRHKSGSASDA